MSAASPDPSAWPPCSGVQQTTLAAPRPALISKGRSPSPAARHRSPNFACARTPGSFSGRPGKPAAL